MATPTYYSGNITREVGAPVEQHRLVKLVEGKVEHNGADTKPYGVCGEQGAPKGSEVINFNFKPAYVRVNVDSAITKVETDGKPIADGADVFAAADGKVSASGSVKVGKAHYASTGNFVKVHLFGLTEEAGA